MESVIDKIQTVLIGVHTVFCATLAFLLLPLFGKAKALKKASRLWSRLIFFTVGVKLEVNSKVNRLPQEPFIVVSNHTSNFDIPALFLAFDRTLYFISKKELQRIPFMGWVMTAFGMVFIDRSNSELARKTLSDAVNEIKEGKTLMSFPEGTRSRTGSVQSFKKGTFHLAMAAQVPIVPVAVTGAASINPPGTWKLESGTIRLSIGRPIHSQKFHSASELSEVVKTSIEGLLEQKPAEHYVVSAGSRV